ncbi:MAG: PA14 domain-containing protein [Chloroflexota bacterium]
MIRLMGMVKAILANRKVALAGLVILLGVGAIFMAVSDWAAAAALPDERLTAYPAGSSRPAIEARWEGDKSAIYLVWPDGRSQKVAEEDNQALWLPMFEKFMALSPDMKYLAYVTADNVGLENARLWLVNLQMGQSLLLADLANDFWVAPLVWSPDSAQIAFVKVNARVSGSETIELWTIQVPSREQSLMVADFSFRPELFQPSLAVVQWASLNEITYTDYTGWVGAKRRYSVNLVSKTISATSAPMTMLESQQVTVLAELPCPVDQLSQNDPAWKSIVMKTCGETIGRSGCALTSTAMVFRYYGVATDSKILNTCLGNSACPIVWSKAASSCSEGKVLWVNNPAFSWQTVESELAAGRPPIIKFSCASYDHFVVAIRGSGSDSADYMINDPWDGQLKSMSAYDSCALNGLRLFDGTPTCSVGACQPGPDQIALFADAGYGGACVTLDVGDYPDANSLGALGDNNAESIKVGSDVQAILFSQINFGGTLDTFTGSDSNLGDNLIGSNTVSSVKVQFKSPPPANWSVSYFNDTNLSNLCSSTTLQAVYVFKDWGDEAPMANCNVDNWSARFTRQVYVQGGAYTFALGSDNWGRVKIDGSLVIDNWQGAGQHYKSGTLAAGWHEVVVEFADTSGPARLSAWWWGPGFNMPRETRDPSQWYAQYWGNREVWWDAVIAVNEGSGDLNHNWGYGSPGYDLPENRFSARFERTVDFACGAYRFQLTNDDGVRFWVDGQLQIDAWYPQVGAYSVDIQLTGGPHELKVEYFDEGGAAALNLGWSRVTGCTPTAPSDLSAVAVSPSQIDLRWIDQSTEEDGFKIERSLDGASNWVQITTVAANATAYSDTNLPCTSQYFYRVRAYSVGENSEYTNNANATTSACQSGVCIPNMPIFCGSTYNGRNDQPGSNNQITSYPCSTWTESGPEVTYRFSPSLTGQATITLTNMSADLDLFILDGASGACSNQNCLTKSDTAANESVTLNIQAGQLFYIVVDGYKNAISDFTIGVQCSGQGFFYLPLVLMGGVP